MTGQLDLRRAIRLSRERDSARQPFRAFWPMVLLGGIVVAGFAGVGVAAYVTDPVAPTPVVYQEPNVNDREGRAPEIQAPNANTREVETP
jgi:hypothetical protein